MIKLVACDMDGTLLDGNGNVPEGTYDLILALREKGVHFVAASGRRYDTLCEQFAPHCFLHGLCGIQWRAGGGWRQSC